MSRNPNASTLGFELYRARLLANLSQKELADLLSCSLRSLQYWEHGQVQPRPASRRRILAFVELTATGQRPEEETSGKKHRKEIRVDDIAVNN